MDLPLLGKSPCSVVAGQAFTARPSPKPDSPLCLHRRHQHDPENPSFAGKSADFHVCFPIRSGRMRVPISQTSTFPCLSRFHFQGLHRSIYLKASNSATYVARFSRFQPSTPTPRPILTSDFHARIVPEKGFGKPTGGGKMSNQHEKPRGP